MFVVLSTTHRGFPTGFSGMAIGLTLGVIHLVTIPVDNTSVNPARSFGSALFSDPEAWTQLWVFLIFPLVGGLLAGWLHRALFEPTVAPPLPSEARVR